MDATLFAKSSQHFWMLHIHVASNCTHCCMLLGIAVQSLKPVNLAMCKGTQQITVGSYWPTMLRPFCQGFKVVILCTDT